MTKVSYLRPRQCNEHTELKASFEKPRVRAHRFALGSRPPHPFFLLCEKVAELGATALNCVLFSSAVISHSFRKRLAPRGSLRNGRVHVLPLVTAKGANKRNVDQFAGLLICFSVPFPLPWYSAHL